jgi:serine protease AprX
VTGGGRYFQISGSSMAAPVVAGIAADVIGAHPTWTPDQVKGAITNPANMRWTKDDQWEVAADWAVNPNTSSLTANRGLTPNLAINPATGEIDYTKATWTKATWTSAADTLKATWTKATWTCAGCVETAATATDPTKATWTKASWSAFFGDLPTRYGEIAGGTTGATG